MYIFFVMCMGYCVRVRNVCKFCSCFKKKKKKSKCWKSNAVAVWWSKKWKDIERERKERRKRERESEVFFSSPSTPPPPSDLGSKEPPFLSFVLNLGGKTTHWALHTYKVTLYISRSPKSLSLCWFDFILFYFIYLFIFVIFYECLVLYYFRFWRVPNAGLSMMPRQCSLTSVKVAEMKHNRWINLPLSPVCLCVCVWQQGATRILFFFFFFFF